MWGKTASKEDIWNKVCDLEQRMEEFSGELKKVQKHQLALIGVFDSAKLEGIIAQTNATFNELLEKTRSNISRVNDMSNELKGIVAMSREALDEGKKFTEMAELKNQLDHVCVYINDFRLSLEDMNQVTDKLLVSCEVPCAK